LVEDKRLILLSILTSTAFAVLYAAVEITVNWQKVFELFSFLPPYRDMSPYNWFFTTIFFLLAAFMPLLPYMREDNFVQLLCAGLGNYELICVVEDASYFLLQGKWITPADWTAKGSGYVMINGVVIPIWYFASLALMLLLYYFAFNKELLSFRYSRFFYR